MSIGYFVAGSNIGHWTREAAEREAAFLGCDVSEIEEAPAHACHEHGSVPFCGRGEPSQHPSCILFAPRLSEETMSGPSVARWLEQAAYDDTTAEEARIMLDASKLLRERWRER